MIIVTGMHRSGTSLAAQLLYESGADLGNPETFYRPDRWNADGYYEQPDIHAVNMPLINGVWGRLGNLILPRPATIQRRASRRAAQISRVAEQYRDCVVKDARFCLTLSAWRDAGAPIDGIVVCLRNPTSVARSLRRRNWLPADQGCRLWLEHNRRLLAAADGLPLRLIRFDYLTDRSRFCREFEPVLKQIGLKADTDDLDALRKKVVKPSLDHFPAAVDRLSPSVRQLWDELCDRHASQTVDGFRQQEAAH